MPRLNRSPGATGRNLGPVAARGLRFEPLEQRVMLAADYGDAATSNGQPYGSASHEAVGPILGVLRDANNLITNSLANGDRQDEDGVAFGFLRAGQAGSITVHVTNAPAGARLDAWIDFSRDANFSSPGDQVVDDLQVSAGENFVTVSIPAFVTGGYYHARVRLSTVGNLAPTGAATNGEVEDYIIPIAHADSGPFGGQQALSFIDATQAIPTDLDSDGDLDLLTSRMTWFENQGGRFGAEFQHTGSTALAVAPADIDNDGDMDYFANVNGTLYWYENNGGQVFAVRQIGSNAPTILNPVDLDDDGDVDLYGTTAWFRNNGSQSFTRVNLPTSQSGERTTAVDMDGDGDRDVVVASTSQGTLQWLENDGSENFTPRPIASIGITLRAVMAADLDADGDIDVVTASSGANGGVAWYKNDGAYSFTVHALDAVGWSSEAVVIADLDADGDLDIAASGSGRVAWYENDGAESFTFRMVAASSGLHAGIAAGDIDGDGRLDIVTAGTFDAPIGWHRQFAQYDYGDAPHPYRVHLQDNGARHNVVGPTLGALRDAEVDGAHAPVGAEAEDDGVTFGIIEIGQGFGTVTVSVQNAPAGARLDAWIDFNGDGTWAGGEEQIFTSLAVSEGDNALTFAIPSSAVPGATAARFRLSTAGGLGIHGAALDGEVEDHELTLVAREPATGLFTGPNAIAGGGGEFMVTADIDGDGDIDVATAQGRVWYENLGPVGFLSHVVSTMGVGGEDFAADDLDGDGDVDFIGFGINQVVWLENDGAQNFTRQTTTVGSPQRSFGSATGLSIVDIDGDGDRDILACDLGEGVYLFLNNGQQQFSTRFLGDIGQYATSVVAADMDGDGDLDVVTGGLGVSSSHVDVAWFQNDGALAFTYRAVKSATPTSFQAGATESVAVGDIDGDGDLDVVAAGVSPSSPNLQYLTLSWHEQVAGNVFVDHQVEFNRNFRWATLADFDADGDLDILANGYTGSIDVYENVGAKKFIRRQISPQNPSMSVAAADIDGDGLLDIVAPGVPGVGLAWFKNVAFVEPDYGDAPSPYPTIRAHSGAVHNGGGPQLGATRDSESDGAPTPAADGDLDDGVTLPAVQVGQASGTLIVNVQNAPAGAKLDAWIDFNGDGSFDGAGEQIFASRTVVNGDNALAYNLPANTPAGAVVGRFRLSTAGGLRPYGAAVDGEVEDHLLLITPPGDATAEYGPIRNVERKADSIRVADIDGDGDADFLTVSGDYPYLLWHENLGDGVFLAHRRGLENGGQGARPIDLDREGDVDFVVTTANGLAWYENDGAQSFTYRFSTGSVAGLRPVFDVADVDNDGDLDVIVSRNTSPTSQIYLLRNNGAQGFSAGSPLTTPPREPAAIRAADVDRDGDVDFAVTFVGDGAGWYENQSGTWAFREVTNPVEAERAGRDIVPIDFDHDGDVDLMALAQVQSNLVVDLYRNNGAQSFTRETIASTQSTFETSWTVRGGDRLQVADLDGDGDLDAAVIGYFGIRAYRNDGPGPLTTLTVMARTFTPYGMSLAIADLDGDGRLEILGSYDLSSGTFWLDDLPFGDYNRDGAVDLGDRDLYEATLGQTVTPPGAGADGDGSGIVDPADLAIWEANQGRGPWPFRRAADFDLNESIDGHDFLRWQQRLGTTSPFPGSLPEDVDYSGAVDGGDLDVWTRQYGQGAPRVILPSPPPPGETSAAYAEPGLSLPANAWLANPSLVSSGSETSAIVEDVFVEPPVASAELPVAAELPGVTLAATLLTIADDRFRAGSRPSEEVATDEAFAQLERALSLEF